MSTVMGSENAARNFFEAADGDELRSVAVLCVRARATRKSGSQEKAGKGTQILPLFK